MDMRKKKKIIILGLCIGFVALLAVYLGLFAGRGTPLFEVSKVYSLSPGEGDKVDVRYVAAVDLFGDGRKEILMSYDVYSVEEQTIEGELYITYHYKDAKVVVLSSNTTSDFHKLWDYDSGLTRQTIAVGDFDGDGKLDLIVGGFKTENEEDPTSIYSRVEILLQEGGSFDKVFSSNIPKFLPGSIVAGDFDGDGRTDFVVGGLAVESGSPYHTYLFHNEGGGDFTVSPIALRTGIGIEDMWKADINSDGSPDLIIRALDFGDDTYSLILLLNDGQGQFEFRELNVPAYLMVIEDFTGDGYLDIIYTKTDQLGDKMYFLRNDQGEFAEPSPIDIQGGEGWLDAIIAGDLNNDGALEAILLERSAGFVGDSAEVETSLMGHLFLVEQSTEGELSFTSERSQKLLQEKDLSPAYAAVPVDMNDDGWIDLIIVSANGEVYLALNQHT